jgi:hypothetical protein
MKKLLIGLVFVLFLVNVGAQDQKLGPDLIIDSLSIEPFPVDPGKSFEVKLNLRNSNARKIINGLEFRVQESFPFSVEGENIRRYNTLGPNERIELIYKINTASNAITGVTDLKIEYEESGIVNYISSPLKIDIRGTGKDPSIVSIRTIPEIIKPGDEVEMILTIQNTVPVLMKNIDINFDLSAEDTPFTPIKTTTKRSLNSLNKASSKELKFTLAVDAEAEPQVYKIPLIIDYEDEFGNEYTLNTLTGLKISTEPILQYNVDDSEIKSSGTYGKISLRIVNVGLADVKFLTVDLLKSEDYDIISVPRVYVGNLESDDYETAEFELLAKTKKKSLPLNLDVSYKDAFNKDYRVNEVIEVPLYSRYELNKLGIGEGNGSFNFIYYLISAVFIYLLIIEWKKTKNLPLALKLTFKHFLVFIKRIIKALRPRTITRFMRTMVNFFREP